MLKGTERSWRAPCVASTKLRRGVAGVAGVMLGLAPQLAAAQTWAPPRTTPNLLDLSDLDETGEGSWLFGGEDVAGDGLDTFQPPEQAIDFRSVYAVADEDDLWLRAYVVSETGVGDVRLFVFVDADANAATGGSAAAASLDARFTGDPTPGGYDFVIAVGSDESLEGVWQWSTTELDYEPVMDPTAEVEAGTDTDPIRIGASARGYLQVRVPLDVVGLDSTCSGRFFVRSLNEGPAMLGDGDLDVGESARCRALSDPDRDPPAVLFPDEECTEDAQCPGQGLCLDGTCRLPPLCREDSDCAADETCSEGRCVFASSDTSCTEDEDCGDLVCAAGSSVCSACSTDEDCGTGRRCASTGRCVGPGDPGAPGAPDDSGLALGDGERIQGGAFTCSWAGPWLGSSAGAGLWVLGLWGMGAACRRVWSRRRGSA